MKRERMLTLGGLIRTISIFVCAILLVGSAITSAAPQDRPPLKIVTESLPDGVMGQPYLGEIQVEGGAVPWAFSATGLPKGLTFGNSDTIHGAPTEAGTFNVVVTVTDSAKPPVKTSTPFKMTIAPAH